MPRLQRFERPACKAECKTHDHVADCPLLWYERGITEGSEKVRDTVAFVLAETQIYLGSTAEDLETRYRMVFIAMTALCGRLDH